MLDTMYRSSTQTPVFYALPYMTGTRSHFPGSFAWKVLVKKFARRKEAIILFQKVDVRIDTGWQSFNSFPVSSCKCCILLIQEAEISSIVCLHFLCFWKPAIALPDLILLVEMPAGKKIRQRRERLRQPLDRDASVTQS